MTKKLRLMMTMLLLAVMGSVWAETVTFDYSAYKGYGTLSSGSEYTMAKTYVSITNDKFYCGSSASYAQFYAGGTTTITPATGVIITQVVLTASSTSYNGYQSSGTISASTGSVSGSTSSTTVTWNGSTTTGFTISNSKQIRWTSIEVSYTVGSVQTHTAAFSVNGTTSTQDFPEGAAITFPENPADIQGRTFVGWIETTIDGTTNEAPTFVTSATMGNSNVTYYAVFATAEASGDPVETKDQTLQYDTWTYSGTTTDKGTYRLFGNGSYIESAAFDLSKLSKVIVYGGTYGGGTYNSLTIGDGTNIWKSGTVSGSSQTGTNTFTGGTQLTGTNKLRITATAGNGTSLGLRISKVEIFISEPSIVYIDYCTTIVEAAVATPTFSPEGGTYDEAQNVTISCETEGAAIYYTIDGSDPTSNSSTPYENAIPVSLGTTTIKAIAYVGEDVSEVATATYIITKKDAELSYSQTSYSVNIYDVFNSPELTNPHNLSPITYGSSDPNVAQVDADGSVSLFGSGTTTITATFGGNDEYEVGTAEYTLNVTRTSSSTIYKKVTSQDQLVEGKKYIIVCDMNSPEGIAMGVPYGSGSTAYRTHVEDLTITDGIIEITNSVVELTLGGNSTNGYTFLASDDEKYLSWTGGNYLEAADNVTTDNGATWKILETEDGFIVANVKQDKDKDNNIKDRVIMYNSNQPRFACYMGTQNPAVLYVQEPGGFEDVIMNNNDGYRTYVTTNNIDWSQTSVKGYRVSAFTKNSVTLPQLTGITKGGTPVIVKCKKGINALVVTNETETEQGTLLHPGKDATEAVKDKLYVLQRVPNSQWDENGDPYQQYNFYKLNPNRLGELQSDTEHAYLVLGETLSTSGPGPGESGNGPGFGSKPTVVSLRFINANDDDPMVSEDGGFPDGIKEVEQNASVNGEFYSISGVRVAAPTKGIYIVNGKKVLVK